MLAIPRRDPGTNASAVLAVGVHVLLLAVLFFGIRWRTKQPEPVMAELWSQLPAVEAPRAEPPPPPPVVAPRPEPKPEPEARAEGGAEAGAEAGHRARAGEEAQGGGREEEARRGDGKEEARRRAQGEGRAGAQGQGARRTASPRRAGGRAQAHAGPARARAVGGRAEGRGAGRGAGGARSGRRPERARFLAAADRAKVKSNIVLPLDLTGNPEAQFDVLLLPTGEVQTVRLMQVEREQGARRCVGAGDPQVLAAAEARQGGGVPPRSAPKSSVRGIDPNAPALSPRPDTIRHRLAPTRPV